MNMPLVEDLVDSLAVLRAKRLPVPEVMHVPLNYAQFLRDEVLPGTDVAPGDEITLRREGAPFLTLVVH